MVSFRKLFLVLAVVGLIAGTASAQVTNCTAAAKNVPLVRFEGLTEPVGDIVITCGGTVSASQSVSFVLRSGTANFTNSIDGSTPPVSTATANGKAGVLASANELDFNDVTLAGTTDKLTVTITNVRVNANAVGTPNTQLSMTVSGTAVTPGVSLAVLPATTVNVASVQSGLTFTVKAVSGSTLTQCSNSSASAMLSFAPGYAYAFRAPGTTSTSEPLDGSATSKGVQLVAFFSSIGANTTITVPNTLKAPSGNASLNAATLVSPAPKSGTTTTDITPTGATQTVIWQVTTIDTTSNATASAPLTGSVSVAQSSDGTIALGASAVRGNLGPISTVSTATLGTDATNIVPRFADLGGTPATLVTVVPCATTLLFPYVVSQAPWETGIAIANTSKDPATGSTFLFGGKTDTTGQAGACTLYYFNGTAGGTNPSAQTTASIAPGNESVFLLGGGSGTDTNIKGVPEFAGYVIAQCNFLGAHGFAFGTSGSANLGAFGYNALVLTRGTSTLSTAETLGQ